MKDTNELEREVELPRVKDFMQKAVHTVVSDTPLDEVLHFFLQRKSENIPLAVVGADKKEFVGIITERECIEYLSNEIFYGNSETTAKGLISKVPLCVSPDTDIFTVSHIFMKHPCRYLPVVRKKILEGITSRPLILEALYGCHQKMVDAKTAQKVCPDLHELINHRFIIK